MLICICHFRSSTCYGTFLAWCRLLSLAASSGLKINLWLIGKWGWMEPWSSSSGPYSHREKFIPIHRKAHGILLNSSLQLWTSFHYLKDSFLSSSSFKRSLSSQAGVLLHFLWTWTIQNGEIRRSKVVQWLLWYSLSKTLLAHTPKWNGMAFCYFCSVYLFICWLRTRSFSTYAVHKWM